MLKYFLGFFGTVLVAAGTYWFLNPVAISPVSGVQEPVEKQKNNDVKPSPVVNTPKQTEATVPAPGMKLYRNDEFGFGFQYPESWELESGTFSNPFSKFNLVTIKIDGKFVDLNTFLLNIVTQEFANNAIYNFSLMHAIKSSTHVHDKEAAKYEYLFDQTPTVAVDVPFAESRILLEVKKEYEQELSQILSTFKFLK